MSELIARGAEAELYKKNQEIIKIRKPKKYRNKTLDERIRKNRTKKEAKATREARKIGVPTPIILDMKDFEIKFEYLDGEKIKKIYSRLNQNDFRKIGKYIAKLHQNRIFHGDLTTSNILKTNRNKIYFIDFGLSGYDGHIEPKGVDLHVLFQTIRSSHPEHTDSINIILNSYKSSMNNQKEIIQRLNEIEERGRYF
ncbi:Kae1-associated kinase Bud32 [archaeon SCG-AAA382B04]|nr:Kae1-associated kinase Bud32 [archaeon SCG-AAA382B04]